MPSTRPPMTMTAKIGIVVMVFAALVLLASGGLWETNRAGYGKICQMPNGDMKVINEPGFFFQCFGEVTEYQQEGTYTFGRPHSDAADDLDDTVTSDPIETRFNDGGTARWSGNVRFTIPIHNKEDFLRIHMKYRSYYHVAEALVGPSTRQALILTSALMSSQDSYSGRKSEFPQLVEDQLLNGVFLTDSEEEVVKDLQSGEEKKIRRVIIRKDAQNNPIRRGNPMHELKMNVTQMFLDKEPVYENGIITQIEKSREATMRIATARAQAEAAVQDKTTAEAEGLAKMATAEYDQKTIKAKLIVTAEQEKEIAEIKAKQNVAVAEQEKLEAETVANKELSVAKLGRETAEQTKQATILLAEGESEARKLILASDGALKAKLEAYTQVQHYWAQAFGSYQGAIVPAVSMGASSGTPATSGNQFADIMNLIGVKAAKDLALNLDVSELNKR